MVGALTLAACQTNGVLGDPCTAMGNCGDDDGTTGGTDDDGMMTMTASPTTFSTAGPDTDEPSNPTGGPVMTTAVPDEGDPDPGPAVCLYTCSSDADCTIMGMDYGLACSQILGACYYPCADDLACIAQYSGWTAQPCTSNDECFAGPCVDYDGSGNGGCGTDGTMNDCRSFGQEVLEAIDVDGNVVLVCGNIDVVCGDFEGEQTCLFKDDAPEPTCADIMCPEPLTCDEADPSCNCLSVEDCLAAGYQNPFDGGEIDCRPLG